MKIVWSAITASACFLAACGGNTPEPTAATSPSAPSGLADDAGAPAPTASPAAASTADAADAGAASSSSSSSSASATGAPVGEMKDECTPVGVDFEKRARPKLKECYAAGKKKSPNLEGTVKIKVTVDLKGKIKAVKVVEKTLPDAVADCMLKAVKATPFPEVDKCWDASLTIPVTFPTPK